MSATQAIYEINRKSAQYVSLAKWPSSIKVTGDNKVVSDPLPSGGSDMAKLHEAITKAMIQAAEAVIELHLPKIAAQIRTHSGNLKVEA